MHFVFSLYCSKWFGFSSRHFCSEQKMCHPCASALCWLVCVGFKRLSNIRDPNIWRVGRPLAEQRILHGRQPIKKRKPRCCCHCSAHPGAKVEMDHCCVHQAQRRLGRRSTAPIHFQWGHVEKLAGACGKVSSEKSSALLNFMQMSRGHRCRLINEVRSRCLLEILHS